MALKIIHTLSIFLCIWVYMVPCVAEDTLEFPTAKSFQDVVDDLEFAIVDRNFRITSRNNLGQAIRERGNADFPEALVIHFCNVEYAREVLSIDLSFIAEMPCRIAVRTEQQTTIISVPLLPTDHPDSRVKSFAQRINAQLQEIAKFAQRE